MKTRLTFEDMETLRSAHLSVRGTPDYQRYMMQNDFKHRLGNGKWSNWKFIGWYIPYSKDEAKIKRIGNDVYIMTEDEIGVDRYYVTPEVNALLGIY